MKIIALLVCFLAAGRNAYAQRVLECRFVDVSPSSFHLDGWSFAADISGGYLHLLLARPSGTGDDPEVTSFAPLRDHRSVYMATGTGTGSDPASHFEMATVGADESVVLDQWEFGSTNDYDRLTLKCPSHP